jgi:hypothetical protein
MHALDNRGKISPKMWATSVIKKTAQIKNNHPIWSPCSFPTQKRFLAAKLPAQKSDLHKAKCV